MEYNDIYDENRNLTGRIHRRGTAWHPGEYGLVVCVWVCNDQGQLLMTRRAPQKSFAGTWENSGGAAQAGEDSPTAIARELFEETGIQAQPEEFLLLDSDRDAHAFYDHYFLRRNVTLQEIRLQPGETDAVQWVTTNQIHEMIRRHEICRIIADQFLRQEPLIHQIAQH